MTKETDDRKRTHLRLVVNNPEKRNPREDDYIGLDDLVARRDELRPLFYRDMDRVHGKAYGVVERFLAAKGWPYGLDPHYGKPVVLPAALVCPEVLAHEMDPRDEALLFVAEDMTGRGLCLSLEMILPFYSDDEAVMENALLYSPLFQYGTMFLEENRQDGLLDLIYRIAFPLYPPALSSRILERLFAVAAQEIADALQSFSGYPED
ncbi:MAG: hypothetical protein GYA56_06220 [Geobacteraceae bacterium]|nr:hypothetical protein [Geobacteraceae bacterium]